MATRRFPAGIFFHHHETENGSDHGHWAYDVWEQDRGGGGLKPETLYSRNKGILAGKKMENAKFTQGGGSEFEWAVTEEGKETHPGLPDGQMVKFSTF